MNQEYARAINKHKYILKNFERFLKEKNVFDIFVNYCYNGVLCTTNPARKEKTFDSYIILMKQSNSLLFLIYRAFVWSETKEGYSFWARIDMKWRDLYDKITNNYD